MSIYVATKTLVFVFLAASGLYCVFGFYYYNAFSGPAIPRQTGRLGNEIFE